MKNDEFDFLLKQSIVSPSDSFVDDLMKVIVEQNEIKPTIKIEVPWLKLIAALFSFFLTFTLLLVNHFDWQILNITGLKVLITLIILLFSAFCIYLWLQTKSLYNQHGT